MRLRLVLDTYKRIVYCSPMDTHTDPTARREAATTNFREMAHAAYHKVNGTDAPCHRCENVAKGEKGFNL
jgi:uncharacterized protein (UPF0248 family)